MLTNRFLRSTAGTVSIISAILMMTLVTLVGAVVDFGIAYSVRSRTQAALDAAVLAAGSEGRKMVLDAVAGDPEDHMALTAERFFDANTKAEPQLGSVVSSFKGAVSNNVLTVEGTATAQYDYYFLPLLGIQNVSMAFDAQASVSLNQHATIDFLVDASGSMGIGATPADQATIAGLTNCAFSCHTRGHSAYATTIASGAQMRIDVARDAIIAALDEVRDEADAGKVKFGLHTFSGITETFQTSTDANADDIDAFETLVHTNTHLHQMWTGTNLGYALDQLATVLPDSGGGLSEMAPRRYVIVISDFVENAQSLLSSGGWFVDPNMIWTTPNKTFASHEIIQPPNSSICDSLVAKGITVFFINTTYLIPTTGKISSHNVNRFDFIEDEVSPALPDRLETCTGSPQRVIEASSVADIQDAIGDVVRATVAPLHLF